MANRFQSEDDMTLSLFYLPFKKVHPYTRTGPKTYRPTCLEKIEVVAENFTLYIIQHIGLFIQLR